MSYENRRVNSIGYGSAAKEAVPEKTEKEIRREKREYVRKARLKVEAKVISKREASKSFTRLQTVVLAASLCTAFFMSLFYLEQLSDNREIRSDINKLEARYHTLQEENGLLENEQNARIDYDAVYVYATETLGMRNPEKQQIITYEAKASEYVRNSGVIPND